MANIKFSAFTQKVALGDVDFLVGYTGADNVRVAPSVFSGIYLPLAGGTMTGTAGVDVPDNFKWNFGNAPDFEIYHNSTTNANYINSLLGRQLLINTDNLWIGNGAGTESMIRGYDAGTVELYYDNVKQFETTTDGVSITQKLSHIGDTNTYLEFPGSNDKIVLTTNGTDALIVNAANQVGIGITPLAPLQVYCTTNVNFTTSANGSNLRLNAVNDAVDATIPLEFNATDYEFLGTGDATFGGNVVLGTGDSLYLSGTTGFRMLHDGANALFINQTAGDIKIQNSVSDKDIIFKGVDGVSSIDALTLDMSDAGNATFSGSIFLADSKYAYFGNANDFYIGHTGSSTVLLNSTGHLEIANYSDDKSIYFKTDDGSGGVTTYIKVDGLQNYTEFPVAARFMDSVQLQFGDSGDGYIKHNGTDMTIENSYDDGDMNFKSDDGSGGVANYFWLDGGIVKTRFSKDANFEDNVKATFGNVVTPDLEIYHDTTDSIIANSTGILYVRATDNFVITNSAGSENIFIATPNGSCKLYYDAANKLETTSTGTKTTGQMDLAALNTAPASASAAGTLGEIRYTADYIYVCTATNTWKRSALSTW